MLWFGLRGRIPSCILYVCFAPIHHFCRFFVNRKHCACPFECLIYFDLGPILAGEGCDGCCCCYGHAHSWTWATVNWCCASTPMHCWCSCATIEHWYHRFHYCRWSQLEQHWWWVWPDSAVGMVVSNVADVEMDRDGRAREPHVEHSHHQQRSTWRASTAYRIDLRKLWQWADKRTWRLWMRNMSSVSKTRV